MKKNLFTLVMVFGVLAVIAGVWKFTNWYLNRGEEINKEAWEASYFERKLPTPEPGPREGYWGAKVGHPVPDEITRWRESETHLAGLVDIDDQGFQYYRSQGEPRHRILILGGSVAYGAYASQISTTYFNVIGSDLDRLGLKTEIIIAAAGAWKSAQEVRALEVHVQKLHPDVVVFLNGLNDLTNGSTSRALYGEMTPTNDGSPWTVLYHAHDYEQRVADYLENMRTAIKICDVSGIDILTVLQPSLNERTKRTTIEKKILRMSLEPHSSSDALTESYDTIRKSLASLPRTGNFSFLDCSRVFDAEKETVFTDIWHFSDFGHKILGQVMSEKIAEILKKRVKRGGAIRMKHSEQ